MSSATMKRYKYPELDIHYPEQPVAAFAITPVTADTYGWDTVYAIPTTAMNQALTQQNLQIQFSESDTGVNPASVSGTFGPWQLTNSGDGQIMGMVAPIATGTVAYNGTSYALDGAQLTFNVELDLIPSPVAANAAGGPMKMLLKVKTGLRRPSRLAAVGGLAVQAANITFSGAAPKNPVPAVTEGLLAQWLNANLNQFNSVFATVNIASKVDSGPLAWMNPTSVGYAFAPPVQPGADGTFAVLAMVLGDSAQGLPYQVSPNAIPSTAPSGYLISAQQFLGNMLLPGLSGAFPNAPAGTFALTASTVIQNSQAFSISFQANGTTYTGNIAATNFNCSISGTQLVFSITGIDVLYSPGIHVNIDYNESLTVGLTKNPDGTSSLSLQQTQLSVTHTVTEEQWVQGIVIAANIVAAIIAGALAFGSKERFAKLVTSKVAAWSLAILCGVLTGGIVAALVNIPSYLGLIADGKLNQLPALDPVIRSAYGQVQWPDSSGFTLISSGLAGSWQLGVNPA
jgi:Clostridium P-47 protein